MTSLSAAQQDILEAYGRLSEAVLMDDRPKVQAAVLRAVAGRLDSAAGALRDQAEILSRLVRI